MIDLVYARILYDIVALYSYNQTLSRSFDYFDPWQPNGVSAILRNDAYTGNLTLQKTFRIDHICKTPRKNDGECAVYKVGESHDAIISQETYDAVQTEITRRATEWKHAAPKASVFTGKLICGNCGKHYRRRTVRRGHVWQCATYALKGKNACASKQVPEDTLIRSAAIALDLSAFDTAVFETEITDVLVCSGNKLTFHFRDGSEKEVVWRDRSRSESWTEEMKQKAREKTNCRCHKNTGDKEQVYISCRPPRSSSAKKAPISSKPKSTATASGCGS